MIRARYFPRGVFTAEQYLVMDKLAESVCDGTMRVTTRQDVQFPLGTYKCDAPVAHPHPQRLARLHAGCLRDVVAEHHRLPSAPARRAPAQAEPSRRGASRSTSRPRDPRPASGLDRRRAPRLSTGDGPRRLEGTPDEGPLYRTGILPCPTSSRSASPTSATTSSTCLINDLAIVPMVGTDEQGTAYAHLFRRRSVSAKPRASPPPPRAWRHRSRPSHLLT